MIFSTSVGFSPAMTSSNTAHLVRRQAAGTSIRFSSGKVKAEPDVFARAAMPTRSKQRTPIHEHLWRADGG